jgi:hypothetical protein
VGLQGVAASLNRVPREDLTEKIAFDGDPQQVNHAVN